MKKRYFFFFILAFMAMAAWSHITDKPYNANPFAASEEADSSLAPYLHFRESMQSKIRHIHGYVKADKLPRSLLRAVVSVEDKRFYDHGAVDPVGIIRAGAVNLYAGKTVEGGSTISQQIIKNTFLSQERTVSRKAKELLLAILLERNYTKDEILAIYLNTAYFGADATGIAQASHTYFAVEPENLTLAQSSMLAGLLQAPTYYNPLGNYKAAKERQQTVLAQMTESGFISADEARRAYEEDLHLQK